MEIWEVHSLLELRLLWKLFRFFPDVLFEESYVRVRVQTVFIDRVLNAGVYRTILTGFVQRYRCEVPLREIISDVADLAESLAFLSRVVKEGTRDPSSGELYQSRRYEMIGHGAQILHRNAEIADDEYGNMLFAVVKNAISCANIGLELLATNSNNERRWVRLYSRLCVLVEDVDLLLSQPVFL